MAEEEIHQLRTQREALKGALDQATVNGREAEVWRALAHIEYRLWANTLEEALLIEAQQTFQHALAYPQNADEPLLWLRCAKLYVSYGSYDGAVAILDRIFLDFASWDQLANALLTRAATYRRIGSFDRAVECFLQAIRSGLQEPYSHADIVFQIAYTYELAGKANHDSQMLQKAREAFADAYDELIGTESEASLWRFGNTKSEGVNQAGQKPWEQWRLSSDMWLQRARMHTAAGHVVLAVRVQLPKWRG